MSRSVSAPSSVTNTSPCWNGDIVPGSMLMYGSNFCSATLRPRETRRRPREDAAIPLPSEDTTPPVTKMYRVRGLDSGMASPCALPVRIEPTGSGSGRLQQLLRVTTGGRVLTVGPQHAHQLPHHVAAAE